MALPSSGTITLANLQAEFGGSNPISMSEYYRNGGLVPSNNTNVPTSGTIALSNFYGAVNEILVTIGNATNVSLSSYYGGNWGSSVPKRLRITGTIGSSNGSAALTINGGMGGTLRIENSGSIQGTSGAANSGGGGSAVYCDPGSASKVTFVNSGTCYAGGGGGGKGGKGGTGGGGYYTYSVWQRIGDGSAACSGDWHDCNESCTMKHSGTVRCEFGSGNRDECWSYWCERACNYYDGGGNEYDDDDFTRSRPEFRNDDFNVDCDYYDPRYCDDCQRLNYYNTNTNGGGGGNGGNGGRGQGYGVSRQNGSGGAGGANGGANAGRGGTGGTGGAGGTWGASGGAGARGATGNSGNRTGGSGGANGSGGGAAGYYIQNRSGMSVQGSGYAGR